MHITSENLDNIFYNLAKRVQKQMRGFTVTIYVVGGANLVHYTLHRESTVDIDIIKQRSVDLRDIVVELRDVLNLPHNWLNDDVMFSASFSTKLNKYVGDSRLFCNCLKVNYISLEAICAMKLRANRLEKEVMLDVLCTVVEKDISLNDVDKIYKDLYNEELDANLLMTMVKASSIFKEYKRKFNVTNIRTEYERLVGVLGIIDMHDLALEVAYIFLD